MTDEGRGFVLILCGISFDGALIGFAWWRCWSVVLIVVVGTASLGLLVVLSCTMNGKALWSKPHPKRKDIR